ncbi:MAG: endonuclease/exonuclease/phosphatase family protein [Thermomicrobiales bacterium]
MRIVSWNCCMAYRKKRHLVELFEPDVAIIQEISRADVDTSGATFCHWVGNRKSKGLGILVFGDHHVEVDTGYTDTVPWFVPLVVDDLHIMAIWATTSDVNARRYVRLIHEAIDHYDTFLQHPRTILIGDFNSNAIFDGKHRLKSHSLMVDRLHTLGISSLYHQQTGEAQGKESAPTFFLHRSNDKPYHFDYAFVSESLSGDADLAIGATDTFLGPSDHLPLILDV